MTTRERWLVNSRKVATERALEDAYRVLEWALTEARTAPGDKELENTVTMAATVVQRAEDRLATLRAYKAR